MKPCVAGHSRAAWFFARSLASRIYSTSVAAGRMESLHCRRNREYRPAATTGDDSWQKFAFFLVGRLQKEEPIDQGGAHLPSKRLSIISRNHRVEITEGF